MALTTLLQPVLLVSFVTQSTHYPKIYEHLLNPTLKVSEYN